MAISKDEVIDIMYRCHATVKSDHGDAAAQSAFFLHPSPVICVPHGEDITMRANYEIHQRFTDEVYLALDPREITPVCSDPERVRAVGAVYWQGRMVGSDAVIKVVVGEDWIVQRTDDGLRIALYINPYHRFLPDSAP